MKNTKIILGLSVLTAALAACQVGSSGSSSSQNNNTTKPSVATAYVSNSGSGAVTICSVNPDGKMFNCALSISGYPGQASDAIYNSRLYLVDYNNSRIMKCPIESNNQLQNCSTALDNINSDVKLNNPSAVTFYNTYAYIANSRANNVVKCSVNTDGAFVNCEQTGNGTKWVSVVNFYNNTAYINNWAANDENLPLNNESILKCDIGISGELVNCLPAGVSSFHPSGMIFSAGFAYIANTGSKNILACKITAGNYLSSCNATGPEISDNMRSIASFESYAYIPSDKGITYCNMGTAGNFESCSMMQNAPFSFNHPFGVTFNSQN